MIWNQTFRKQTSLSFIISSVSLIVCERAEMCLSISSSFSLIICFFCSSSSLSAVIVAFSSSLRNWWSFSNCCLIWSSVCSAWDWNQITFTSINSFNTHHIIYSITHICGLWMHSTELIRNVYKKYMKASNFEKDTVVILRQRWANFDPKGLLLATVTVYTPWLAQRTTLKPAGNSSPPFLLELSSSTSIRKDTKLLYNYFHAQICLYTVCLWAGYGVGMFNKGIYNDVNSGCVVHFTKV